MAKIDFYKIDKAEKEAIFNEIATQKGMSAFAVEKDWWVSRTLEIIFQMEIAKHLVFKGGTSLSKAWKLINRFSEDIDLAIDKKFFGFTGELGKNQRDKLRKTAGAYTTGTFFEELKQTFEAKGFTGLNFVIIEAKDSDQDPRVLDIYFPNIITPPSEYLLPRVQIEVSCRSLREPFTIQTFGSLVDEFYADKDFAEPLFEVPTVNAERTFLEKICLLHEEFQRPPEKRRVNRLSRHLYDVASLSKTEFADNALRNSELFEAIVVHRQKFTRVGGVDYNLHQPQTINILPAPEAMKAWETDYNTMLEQMIYDENPPTFEMILEDMNNLKYRINSLPWKLKTRFPPPNP